MPEHEIEISRICVCSRGIVALVTGACSGIGAGTAKTLAAKDCHVVLVARTKATRRYQKREILSADPSLDGRLAGDDLEWKERGAGGTAAAATPG